MALPKLLLEDGTVATQANVALTNDPDPIVVIGVDVYQRRSHGPQDPRNAIGGTLETLYCRAGTKMRKSELNLILAPGV